MRVPHVEMRQGGVRSPAVGQESASNPRENEPRFVVCFFYCWMERDECLCTLTAFSSPSDGKNKFFCAILGEKVENKHVLWGSDREKRLKVVQMGKKKQRNRQTRRTRTRVSPFFLLLSRSMGAACRGRINNTQVEAPQEIK